MEASREKADNWAGVAQHVSWEGRAMAKIFPPFCLAQLRSPASCVGGQPRRPVNCPHIPWRPSGINNKWIPNRCLSGDMRLINQTLPAMPPHALPPSLSLSLTHTHTHTHTHALAHATHHSVTTASKSAGICTCTTERVLRSWPKSPFKNYWLREIPLWRSGNESDSYP